MAKAEASITSEVSLTPNQIARFLERAIPRRFPTLIIGQPGVGKTSVARQVAEKLGMDLIIDHPIYSDPTDARGLGFYDAKTKEARFVPAAKNLKDVLKATRPTLWVIDDFGQSTAAVQASYMPPLLDRQIDGEPLPDCVSVIATSNERQHKAGVQGLLEPVKSRFHTILRMHPNLDDTCSWLAANGYPGEISAFLRFRTELLCKFDPTADLRNSPCPRTWAHVGDLLTLNLGGTPEQGFKDGDPEVETAVIMGAVGEGATHEFLSFLRVFRSLPDIDTIAFKDPMKGTLPRRDQGDVLYATASALSMRASVKTFDNIAVYMDRLEKAGLGEFAVCIMEDSYKRCPAIQDLRDFQRHITGSLGRLWRSE